MSLLGRVGKALASTFWDFGSAPEAPLTSPNGGDGVQAYGGFLPSDERRPELTGSRKWLTYANAYNVAVIATGIRYRAGLLGGAKWHCEPNPRGGADAQRGVDIVEQGLIHAQMSRPWNSVVRKASLYTFTGFSLHEWTIRRRPDDGMVVFAEIAHRPQHTIDRWNKPSEQEPWDAVHQLTHAGNSYVIPRNRLFYCWDDLLTDMPDGMGLLRHVIELVRRLNVLEGLEGVGFETDLRGMPIGRAPIRALIAEAEGKLGTGATKAQIDAYVSDKTQSLRSALANIVKSPEKLQYLLLDSGTYQGANPDTITSVQRWALELLSGSPTGLAEINTAITRLQTEMARVLGIEFALMGSGSGGSRAMHTDKTSMLAQALQTTLLEIGAFATNDLARVLVALNGLDPDVCTPQLVAEPIATDDVLQVCQALQAMAAAALQPNDPAIQVLRDRMSLPAPPDPEPELMGVAPPGVPDDGGGDGPPGSAQGEVDDTAPESPGEQAQKYAPDQARDEGGRWASGGGSGGSARPWTLAFDSRDHQRTIDQHRRTEADHRAKAAALKQRITDLRASGGTKAQIARLSEQRDQHRAAAVASREAKQAAQAHLEAARAEHTAGRRAAAAERGDAEWDRARAEADSTLAIGQHRIAGDDGRAVEPAVVPEHHVQQVSEAETADRMQAASDDLQRQSEAMRVQQEHADLARRLGSGLPTPTDRQVVHYAPPTQTADEAHAAEAAQRQREIDSDLRARARNEALRPAPAAPLPVAETHSPRPSLLGRLFGRKKSIAKAYADAIEDARLDAEAALDELEEQEN